MILILSMIIKLSAFLPALAVAAPCPPGLTRRTPFPFTGQTSNWAASLGGFLPRNRVRVYSVLNLTELYISA